MKNSETLGFGVPPQLLYDAVTDLGRADPGVPRGARGGGGGGDRVRGGGGAPVAEYELTADPDLLRVPWRAVDPPHQEGTVLAQDSPGGGSRLRVTVSTTEGMDGPQRVREVLDRAARQLE